MSRPYQQRRAYATCKKVWPEVEVCCASLPLSLDNYVESIGDARKVIDMLVGDTQRIELYAEMGFSIQQDVQETFAQRSSGYASRVTLVAQSRGLRSDDHQRGNFDASPMRSLRAIADAGERGRVRMSRTRAWSLFSVSTVLSSSEIAARGWPSRR